MRRTEIPDPPDGRILSADRGFGGTGQSLPLAADVPAAVGLPLRIHSKPTAVAGPIVEPAPVVPPHL
jgi:hypothetical protein